MARGPSTGRLFQLVTVVWCVLAATVGSAHAALPRQSGALTGIVVDASGAPVAGAAITAELASGTHTIVVRVEPKKLPESLRLESSTGTFATP